MKHVEDIASIAKDKWRFQFLSMNAALNAARRFREPREAKPFGFDYMGASVEVHPVCGKSSVMALNIYGVLKDGSLRLIVTEPV